MRYCLLIALALLTACQASTPVTSSVPDSLPRSLPEKPVNLLAYPVPAPPGYQFMGDAKLEVSRRRVFVYHSNSSDSARLQLAIYAIPRGWEDMARERLVAGHFGQVRESLIHHLLRSSSRDLEVVEDRLVDSNALPYPMGFSAIQQGEQSRDSRRYTLMLSAHQPLFVRMEHIDSGEQGLSPQQAQALMEAVVAQLFDQGHPDSGNAGAGSSSGESSADNNDSQTNGAETSTDAATAEGSR